MSSNRQPIKIITLMFCFVIVPLILLLLTLIQPVAATSAKFYTELTFPALPEVQVPDYTRFQLQNGLVVYLMEDHEFPLVSGTALVRTGDRLEPSEQVGLAGLTGEVLRTGGTRQRTADQLNQQLEQRAAAIEVGIGVASGSADFNALTENLEEVFGLFAEVIREPAFAPEKLELGKTQRQGAIARRNDNPDEIAGREFEKLVYGSTSPYGRTVEYATLDNISRNDVVSFYQRFFQPNNTILGIVGDFDRQAMRKLVEAKFGNWQPNTKLTSSKLPTVSQAKRGGVFVVDQPQLSQSYIQMGHLGGQLNSPDYAALTVMNEVLSGFGGRLFNEVRSRQGLAYSVYGLWSPQYDYPGVFVAGGQTRSDATVPFIKSVLAEIDRIRTAPITETELKVAKDSVLNSFIFNFQNPSQTLSRLMRYEYFGYPSDFIFRYRRAVEQATIADIQRVAQTYLKPENIVTLVVGNRAAIQPPLASLGAGIEVTAIDVTIPEPKS